LYLVFLAISKFAAPFAEMMGKLISRVGFTNFNEWQAIDAIYSVSDFAFKLWNWKSTRLFVVVREEVQSNKGRGQQADRLTRLRIPGLCEKPKRFSLGTPELIVMPAALGAGSQKTGRRGPPRRASRK
jgi:hypothetical protein